MIVERQHNHPCTRFGSEKSEVPFFDAKAILSMRDTPQ